MCFDFEEELVLSHTSRPKGQPIAGLYSVMSCHKDSRTGWWRAGRPVLTSSCMLFLVRNDDVAEVGERPAGMCATLEGRVFSRCVNIPSAKPTLHRLRSLLQSIKSSHEDVVRRCTPSRIGAVS